MALEFGDRLQKDRFVEKLRQISETNGWGYLSDIPSWFLTFGNEEKEKFHSFWTVDGRRIREQVDDDSALSGLLRRGLPKYVGQKQLLYRGENLDRLKEGRIGFCWTREQKVAEMFARGLNSVASGGVVLENVFEPEMIIAGPSRHSIYLGELEYTVDPVGLFNPAIVTAFPPSA